MLEPAFSIFERPSARNKSGAEDDEQHAINRNYDAILFGLGRYGTALAERLSEAGERILCIDFNPDEVRRWRAAGYEEVYGDACDHEFMESLPLENIKWIIAALPQHEGGLTHQDPRMALIEGLGRCGFSGRIAVPAHRDSDVERLRAKGADAVLLPFRDAADRAAKIILKWPADPDAP